MHPNQLRALLSLLLLALLLPACGSERPEASPGGRAETPPFPPGDANRGYAAFEKLHCTSCHQVVGYDFPAAQPTLRPPMVLGEKATAVPSPWKLFSDVVDPNHELAEAFDRSAIETGGTSIMPDYGHVMTVRQLVDVVAFLRDAYRAAAGR